MVNVPPRPLQRVGAMQTQGDLLAPRRGQAQSRDRFEHRLEPAPDLERAGHVGLTELQMRVEQHAPERPGVTEDERPDGWLRAGVGRAAVPELEAHTGACKSPLQQRRQQLAPPANGPEDHRNRTIARLEGESLVVHSRQ